MNQRGSTWSFATTSVQRNTESHRQTRSNTTKNPPRTKEKSMSSSSVNSHGDNEPSTDNDDDEYIKVNDDSPNDTPNIVETPRSKLNFRPTSSKGSSTSKQNNISSIDSVVKEVMQQSADRQEKMLEIQQQRLQYEQLKEHRKRKTETNKEKEIDLNQQRLDMEKEQDKATMQAQMAQMEAFSNNAKSTQETNLKMIEFMAMMTQKMGNMELRKRNPNKG